MFYLKNLHRVLKTRCCLKLAMRNNSLLYVWLFPMHKVLVPYMYILHKISFHICSTDANKSYGKANYDKWFLLLSAQQLQMNFYAWKMRATRSQCFSPQMNDWHWWQLKKIKILGAVLELSVKQHCRSSPFTSKLGQIGQIGSAV